MPCLPSLLWAYSYHLLLQGNIYRNRTNYHSKFQTEGCRRVVGVSFPSACELLCRRPPLFQRGGMGIYAVFPERHAALCGESEKMTLLSVTCSLCVRMKTLIMWGGISTNVLKAKDSLVKRQPDCWIIFPRGGRTAYLWICGR